MAFSKELTEKLERAWNEKKEISIDGVNCVGDKFSTTGRITTTDKGKSAIYPSREIIYIEFGQSKDDTNRKQTKYFAPFHTVYAKDSSNDLIILNIKIDDVCVFENPKTQKIIKETTANYEQEKLKLIEEKRFNLPDCDVVNKLSNMIGHPICLNGQCGVFVKFDGRSKQDSPIVHLRSGPLVGCTFVYADSVLETENNKGEKILIAKNNPKEFERAVLKAHAQDLTGDLEV